MRSLTPRCPGHRGGLLQGILPNEESDSAESSPTKWHNFRDISSVFTHFISVLFCDFISHFYYILCRRKVPEDRGPNLSLKGFKPLTPPPHPYPSHTPTPPPNPPPHNPNEWVRWPGCGKGAIKARGHALLIKCVSYFNKKKIYRESTYMKYFFVDNSLEGKTNQLIKCSIKN